MSNDIKWMNAALALARRGLGNVAPNPAVGCLIVKGDVVLGRGRTQPGGRPHAEPEALKQAGECAKGATAYVTLEPCAHHGVTPPCTEALVAAGINRVVIAASDSDERVSGKGEQMLRNAGIDVMEGVLAGEARELNCGFFNKIEQGRPSFTLKVASTLDGRIATETGDSKWITGSTARRYGHMLRAQHDAILVGVNTVLADDPDLSCRIEGLEDQSPIRIVLDSSLKTPEGARILKGCDSVPTWVVANKKAVAPEKAEKLEKNGVRILKVEDTRDISDVAKRLAEEGLTRVLVEGGGAVHASFLNNNLCDTLHVFSAPKVIGSNGLAAVGDLGLAQLANAPHLRLVNSKQLGEDLLATYKKAE